MSVVQSPKELSTVHRVQFGVINPDELVKLSVCEVTSPITYENGIPAVGGLLDHRMGVTDRGLKCGTCHMDQEVCPGHFGHINLAAPVIHVGFARVILSVLRCVCYHCGKLLVGPNSVKGKEYHRTLMITDPKLRLQQFTKLCSGIRTCSDGQIIDPNAIAGNAAGSGTDGGAASGDGSNNPSGGDGSNPSATPGGARTACGGLQPRYTLSGYEITRKFEQSKTDMSHIEEHAEMTGAQVREILERISDHDIAALGFNAEYCHPKWLVTTVLPVSPPQVRPSVIFNGSDRSADDITAVLADIVKVNISIQRQQRDKGPSHGIAEDIKRLAYYCAVLVNNEMSSAPQQKSSSGKVLKTLRQRLVGKGGRVRSNLMGKRVNFCARTVITGDPNLGIDYVGVPRWIARTLTYPEVVTTYNMEYLSRLVQNGPDTYPGAQRVITDDGQIIHLKYGNRAGNIRLQVGFIVERHLIDDDYIMFNRQPSLHKMSLMGHKARIMPYSSFRLNLSCTTPYNADFDGDEMNLHVAQTPMLRAEIAEIMLSPRQVVTPQSSRPVMSIVQDSLLGVSKFTRRDTFCTRSVTNDLLMTIDTWDGTIPQPAILKPQPLWTGKQLFSLIVPAVSLLRRSKHRPDSDRSIEMSYTDGVVLIVDGQLISGIVDSNTVGRTAGGLIHLIWIDRGWDQLRQFMTSCQKLTNNWLLTHGFSVGIGDLVADKETMDDVNAIIEDSRVSVEEAIDQARSGRMERKPGQSIISTFESKVNDSLNQAIRKSGSAVQAKLTRDNSINAMVYAGSKGSHLNISQIVACVGQQNVSGQRVPFAYQRRSLPHFQKEDVGLASRGFVGRSYMEGLQPSEFMFHAMGGREGLVDTAVKTAETGYIQRRLVKAMEAIKVHYDATVRNSLGDIIQFAYGEDGMDGCWIEQQEMSSVLMDNATLQENHYMDITNISLLEKLLTEPARDQLLSDPSAAEILAQEFRQISKDRDLLRVSNTMLKLGESKIYLPVNIPRLIWNAQNEFHLKVEGGAKTTPGLTLNAGLQSDLSPLEIISKVNELSSKLVVIPGDDPLSVEAQTNATMLFNIYLRQSLSAKRVLGEHHLNRQAFDYVLGEIERRFKQAIVHPGEMVGPIAAQSIGEPTTQMTLNTFHMAGYSAKNVTLGVPRLQEIINVASDVKMKGMTIELQPDVAFSLEKTKKVLNRLEFTRVCDLATSAEIYHDPDVLNCVVEEDRDFVNDYLAIPDENDEYNYELSSPWLLRIVLDKKTVLGKDMSVHHIASLINQHMKVMLSNTTGGNTGDDAIRVKCICNHDNSDPLILHVRVSMGKTEVDPLSDDMDTNLENILTVKRMVLNDIRLCGIPDIAKIFLRDEKTPYFDNTTGEYREGDKRWILDTEGTNLREVMIDDDVDHRQCYSNFCPEIFFVLGIEAARAAVLKELRAVIEFDGSYISYRHVAMLVDVMTFKGGLMSVTRHGFNRLNTGPLMRCSYEQTVEILMDAAAFAENDPVKGISEKVMLGQLGDFGTGSFDVVLDTDKVIKYTQQTSALKSGMTSGFGATGGTGSGNDGSDVDFTWRPQADTSGEGGDDFLDELGFSPQSMPLSSSYGGGSGFDMKSSAYNMMSPTYMPQSSMVSSSHMPMSSYHAPTSSMGQMSSSWAPTSSLSPTSAAYSPTSNHYSPTSAHYSPTSNAYSPTSAAYSPTSAGYSPTSAGYSPTSAGYSPTSAGYSPTSAGYSPTSAGYSPTSAGYSPTSAAYSPTSAAYSPTSAAYSPTSAAYSPTSAAYSPTSAAYSPTSAAYSPTSAAYSPTSAAYSPTSPAYSPTNQEDGADN